MCAQLNSPLGPSHNNKQPVTSNTRLHYQLNYQLTLIRTRAWNEFGCNPASFFCCVPEHSCEWVSLCTPACECALQGTKTWCLPFTVSQVYFYERNSWESLGFFQSWGHKYKPHFLQTCLTYLGSIWKRQYTHFLPLGTYRKYAVGKYGK